MGEQRAPIPPPVREAPRIGLISSAPTNTGGSPALPDTDPLTGARLRWEGGLTFIPEKCGPTELIDPCDAADAVPDPDAPHDPVIYDPWQLVVVDSCGTQERTETIARTRRLLERMLPSALEAEFEAGTRAQAQALSNNYLANAASAEDITPANASGAAGVVQAHAELAQYLAETCDGGRGMIHAPRRVVSHWDSAGLVRREPGSLLILDLFENIVVPGVGYRGIGPGGVVDATGETAWAYATGMVQVRLTRPTSTPSGEDDLASIGVPLTEDNEVLVIASRFVAAYWDGIEHAAINVGLCSPCCEPVTGS